MIKVTVEYLYYPEKWIKEIELEINSTLDKLLEVVGLKGIGDDLFLIVNGDNKDLNYRLKDGDYIKIFPAMSGG